MPALQIHQFPCRSDNYGVLVHDPRSGATAAIDAPEEGAVVEALAGTGWKLTDIFVTHHHFDHVEGIPGLKRRFGVRVLAPRGEAAKIPDVDATISGGESFQWGGVEITVLDTPGHTLGHITYVIAEEAVAFAGDTLFAMGCGRIIEGTPAQMWVSLQALAALPPATRVYCGHEYTIANGRFALSVDAGNPALVARMAEVEALRAAGRATLPTTIAAELATNPFLRAIAPEVKAAIGMAGAGDEAVFARLRQMKNDFKG